SRLWDLAVTAKRGPRPDDLPRTETGRAVPSEHCIPGRLPRSGPVSSSPSPPGRHPVGQDVSGVPVWSSVGGPLSPGVGRPLRLPEDKIDSPAATDMGTGTPAMGQDVLVPAAGILQGIGQDRQSVEGPVVVDGLGQTPDGSVIPRQPAGLNPDGS